MSVKFHDYYQTLGVSRTASQDEIQSAFRKLARQYHPDVSKEAGAEKRFKEINEAYEVLKDPARRKKYDTLGADWKAGQDFTPPPGWENFQYSSGGDGKRGRGGRGRARSAPDSGGFGEGFGFGVGGAGGFSDFFEAIFGGGAGSPFGPDPRAGRGPREGATHEAEITVSLDDAYRGGTRRISLQTERNGSPAGSKTYDVRIPAGITDGATIRLAGQGGAGSDGGPAGDLLLRVRIAPDPRFIVSGHDLTTTVAIAPWEAALGAKVTVPTLDGDVTMTIPAGSQSGQRLRLRGKGLPKRQGAERGDGYVELRIVVPKELSPEEREAFETLKRVSNFDPRKA